MIHGSRMYESPQNARNSEAKIFRLRRNTHRLEKGLIMRPRREVFALGYISELVNDFGDLVGNTDCDPSTIHWSSDVLARYFQVTGENDELRKLASKFEADRARSVPAPKNVRAGLASMSPFSHGTLQKSGTSVLDFKRLAAIRRSVRWYQQRVVPREAIDTAIEIAALSPSACNRQPFHFRVFDDPKRIREIASIPGGTAGFSHNFPCLVVVVGQLRAFPLPRDRHVIYIDASLATMSLLYALEVQGISSCCINWPDEPGREKRMAECLSLAPDERVIMLISVGYADESGEVPYSSKRELGELRSFN